MITTSRHGRELRFPDVPGATEVPYTYRPFLNGDWYEEGLLEHIRRLGRSGVYVDAGANVGTATSWFAALCPATHVHAFEPVSRFADQLDRVIAENDLGDRVTLHRLGLSDHPGIVTNHLDRSHQVGFDSDPSNRDETFPVTTLDELISDPVAVIKIDVEGMEHRVLKGATRILQRDSPTVYFEAWTRARVREVADILKPYGYSPTGKVFNASPTYEFGTTLVAGASARLTGYQIQYVVRRTAWRAAKKIGMS